MTRWLLVGIVMVNLVLAAPALGQPSPTCRFEPATVTLGPGDSVEVLLTAEPDAWDGWRRVTVDGVAAPALDIEVVMVDGVFTYAYDEVVDLLRAATGSPAATTGTVSLGFSTEVGSEASCTLGVTLEGPSPDTTTSMPDPAPTSIPTPSVNPRFTG